MKDIDDRFKSIRVNIRKYGTEIADDIVERFQPSRQSKKQETCIFCNSVSKITKEHVIPKWLFENNPDLTAVSSVNKQTQTYNKLVVPVCADCNNTKLSGIENYIIKTIEKVKHEESLTADDKCNLIRWLEIIEYKLQVYDWRRKYIKYGHSAYDETWGEFPISMMRHFFELNPYKAYTLLRSSQRRVQQKGKLERTKSLLFMKTPIPHFSFFNLINKYIYISFPNNSIAIFYFIRKKHKHWTDMAIEALEIIQKVDKSD